MKLLLASGNIHKKTEFERILAPHDILMPEDIGIEFKVHESGNTYLENSLIKAQYLFNASGKYPVLADDSGLSVPALGGAPGVFSARYGSEKTGRVLDSADRNAILLKNTAHLTGKERQGFFVCCIVLMLDEYRIFSAQETFPGYIATESRGTGGFGYDPIFYLPDRGCCVAELNETEKDTISHRGRSCRRLKCILDSL